MPLNQRFRSPEPASSLSILADTEYHLPQRHTSNCNIIFPSPFSAGCFCGLGLVSTNKSCSMPPISFQDLPLNIYMVIFGTGIFVFMLSLIFCCYFIRWVAPG